MRPTCRPRRAACAAGEALRGADPDPSRTTPRLRDTRMMNPRLCLFAVCAALAAPLLTSPDALAQSAVDAASLARSRAAFERGNALYDAGKLPQAEAAYLEAWSLKKSFDVAGNLGTVQADMGKARDAAEHMAYALREFPAGGKPALRDALMKRLADVQRQVGTVRVQASRAGAEIFVDNMSAGITPLSADVFVNPGNHLIEARMDGSVVARVEIAAGRGTAQEVTLQLGSSSGNLLVYGGIGATALAAIAGGVFTGLAASKGGSLSTLYAGVPKSGCPDPTTVLTAGPCNNLKSALESRATFSNVAMWSFIGAGVVGAGTLVYALVGSSSSPQQTGLTVVPVVGAGTYGLVVGGKF